MAGERSVNGREYTASESGKYPAQVERNGDLSGLRLPAYKVGAVPVAKKRSGGSNRCDA